MFENYHHYTVKLQLHLHLINESTNPKHFDVSLIDMNSYEALSLEYSSHCNF